MKAEPVHVSLAAETQALHAVGLRVTGPRLAVLGLLQKDRSHPTAEQVFERLRARHPGLSLSTVYNTLHVLARRGLCRRMPAHAGGQRFDGTTRPHHHAVCVECGKIFDLPPAVYQPPHPPRLETGLEVQGVQVTFEVLCGRCARHRKRTQRDLSEVHPRQGNAIPQEEV